MVSVKISLLNICISEPGCLLIFLHFIINVIYSFYLQKVLQFNPKTRVNFLYI